ncbi:hypothetical protein EWM64_g4721 [Hericium alpestre]|uniref:Uncharacterized protein n=1 Tax=Hericium alpestre TaxID=135208 RepID=A0A4Y9ZZ17_9AGAM|nr:hypothetical protein EWM64_g4721 [Hericium alpestre]
MREDNASYQIPGPAEKTYLGPGFMLRQRTEDDDEVDATPERGFAIIGGRVIGKAARKTKEGASAGAQLATKSVRPVVVDISSSSDSDGSEHGLDTSADALIAAVEALTLHGMEKTRTLPFLPRTVRKGFTLRCERKGIPMTPAAPPKQTINVICQREDEDDDAAFRGEMMEWLCPLCSFHGSFATRSMLTAHLQWDHPEVHFEWSDRGPSTNLNVMIPDLQSDSSDDTTSASRSPTPIPLTITPEDIVDVKQQLIHVASPSREMSTGPPPSARSPSPLALKLKFEARPIRAEPEEHAARPPPATIVDPRPGGPAARGAFLPAHTEGGNDVFYSCRPGGPRLYDLIGTLPMEEFGLMGWSVIEREEEIFEMDSMRDEDKVMSALWLRWILVHRKEFIRNYHKGVESFVKSNLRMIYLAAGRYALRIWLLMLHNHRFLTPHEMALILKLYDGLVEKLEAPQQPTNTGT